MSDELMKLVLDQLEKMDGKLDATREDIGQIKTIQAEQAKDLEYHILRTNILEDAFRPVERHVGYVNGFFKILIGAGVVAGAIKGLLLLL
jgi:hypothetical protein